MTPRAARRRWTFLAPTLDRPTGGDLAMFHVANALARAADDVSIVHVPFQGRRVRTLADVPWFDFEPALAQVFAARVDLDALPSTDALVYSTKLLASGSDGPPPGLAAGLAAASQRPWTSILFLQGLGVFPPTVEDLVLSLPGPKACVGSWLVDEVVGRGADPGGVFHVPNGIDPDLFRVRRPVEGRAAGAAMSYDPHPVKGGDLGLAALVRAHRDLGIPATAFGPRPPGAGLEGVRFEASPSQPRLAELYNEASIYLQPSRREGFGMCAVEAMASGCALVTTANGGSADYALDGETALVCGGEPESMFESVARLVRDDRMRVALATAGVEYVARFRWSLTAERLGHVADATSARAERSVG